MAARLPSAPTAAVPPFMTDHTLGCRTHDPDLWFPDSTTAQAAKKAKQICGDCTRRDDCLQWALETQPKHGIYGGLTRAERLNLQPRIP